MLETPIIHLILTLKYEKMPKHQYLQGINNSYSLPPKGENINPSLFKFQINKREEITYL